MEKSAWRRMEMPLKIGEDDIFSVLFLPVGKREPCPAVILSHGYGGSSANCEPYAEIFAANGYICCVPEFRGGGPASRSSRSMTEMSVLTETADLCAVLEQVRALDCVDESQVFLWGESQGGFVSAIAAARCPDKVKAMVLFYPAFVIQDAVRAQYPNPANIPETSVVMGNLLGAVYARDVLSVDIYDVMRSYGGDVLIVHGDQDALVPLAYSERAASVYASAKLIVVPGGYHGFWDRLEETAGYSLDFLHAHTA